MQASLDIIPNATTAKARDFASETSSHVVTSGDYPIRNAMELLSKASRFCGCVKSAVRSDDYLLVALRLAAA